MDTTGTRDRGEAFSLGGIATALIDSQGIVLRWSRAAAELVGRTAAEVCGRSVVGLLADTPNQGRRTMLCGSKTSEAGEATLVHRSGRRVDVTFHALRLDDCSEMLLLAAPTRQVTDWEQGSAFLRALLVQDRLGLGIHDADLTIVRTNLAPDVFGGPAPPVGGRLREVLSDEDAKDIEVALREVLETGVPVLNRQQRVESPHVPGRQWILSLSAFRLEGALGHPMGVAVLFTDATERRRAQRRSELRQEAALRIGRSLDVMHTAQDLADVLVPAFGDLAHVDLPESVFEGDEPPKMIGGGQYHVRRAAVASATGSWPEYLLQPGEPLPKWPDSPGVRSWQQGEIAFAPDQAAVTAALENWNYPLAVPKNGHSVVSAPLLARDLVLGDVTIWRTEQTAPFEQEDVELLAELASRAALSVDNARRYTREHRAAVALQQRLLPGGIPTTPAAEAAGFYRPAGGGAEIGGDWYDVFPLPSLRVAFVVGDVLGHGLPATATMGRLRTAVRTLADLELDPTELLAHLDDLVRQLADEAPPRYRDTIGATCLYAVYDPVTRCCTLATAGHPPPLVVRPDGITEMIDVSPGPPLGVGGLPFETATLELAPGSILAFYTDGLMHHGGYDLDAGLRRLTNRLAAFFGPEPDRDLGETGHALLSGLADTPPRDDIALLLARTRALPAENITSWEFPADPAVVTDARKVTARQLTEWGLDELAFTTELIVSELVTNAIRYAGAPVGLRLIRDHVLVCEVTDPSNTQPRLRRAGTTDEGGRGLFLIAQLTTRWGSRYSQRGKTIWTEQALTMPAHSEL
ncbi:SpoIIE family protein phosphatase [Streptomyces europaeiscabiei]|uniref:ATP-binding SpoIIE family protein phosphatase n=1 Tax=Streptomyces europaeiscabiei TaxID=146819 RepID=UPI00062836E4|nr:SpoIIE family protein phosphatase [Streptomyces europaeiscabiei]